MEKNISAPGDVKVRAAGRLSVVLIILTAVFFALYWQSDSDWILSMMWICGFFAFHHSRKWVSAQKSKFWEGVTQFFSYLSDD